MGKLMVKGRDGKNYLIEEEDFDEEKYYSSKDKGNCDSKKRPGKDSCDGHCGDKKGNCGSAKNNKGSVASKNGNSLDDLFNNAPDDDDDDGMFNFGDISKMYGPVDND